MKPLEVNSIEARANKARGILRSGNKIELEASLRAWMNVRWCEILQSGDIRVLDAGYRELTPLELVNFTEQLDQGAEGSRTMGQVLADELQRDLPR
jgi:hypothetical protein